MRADVSSTDFESIPEEPEGQQIALKTTGRKIVDARAAAGMTQAELAHACGMQPTNLCRIENGKSNPSVATLGRIAEGLGLELEINFK